MLVSEGVLILLFPPPFSPDRSLSIKCFELNMENLTPSPGKASLCITGSWEGKEHRCDSGSALATEHSHSRSCSQGILLNLKPPSNPTYLPGAADGKRGDTSSAQGREAALVGCLLQGILSSRKAEMLQSIP